MGQCNRTGPRSGPFHLATAAARRGGQVSAGTYPAAETNGDDMGKNTKRTVRPSARAMTDDQLAQVMAYGTGSAYRRAAAELGRRGGLSGRRGVKYGAR